MLMINYVLVSSLWSVMWNHRTSMLCCCLEQAHLLHLLHLMGFSSEHPAPFFHETPTCMEFFLEPADKQIIQQINQAENILARGNEPELKYMEHK